MTTSHKQLPGALERHMSRACTTFRRQNGQALVAVLMLMAVGGLVLPPLLGLVDTSLKLEEVHRTSLMEFYAADAGIEDALWQINADELETLFPDYDRYAFSENGALRYWYSDYPATAATRAVNGKEVDVGFENVWIPQGLAIPTASAAQQRIDDAKLVVTGGITAAGTYRIRLTYNHDNVTDPDWDELAVDLVGIWLPPGFTYVEDSSSLEDDPFADYYCVPSTGAYKSGQVVIWDFTPDVSFYDLPEVQPAGYPLVASISFDFVSSGGSIPDAAVSWVTTSGVSDVDYAWDADVRVFKLTSVATDLASGTSTTVESYTARTEIRRLTSAIPGDYFATGSSLLQPTETDRYRDRLYKESSATIATDETGESGIPSQAIVAAAYLYWTGWIDWHAYNPDPLFYENCSDWSYPPTNWTHGSQWSLSYGDFRGRGGGTTTARRLTMSNSLDLSAYEPGTVTVSWDQDESGYLESDDYLYYSFSGNGGSTWSGNFEAFHNDSPPGTFTATVPDAYLTSNFRMRFYFTFTSWDEYVYLDNITISGGASLKCPEDPTADDLERLIETAARTNVVKFRTEDSAEVDVVANQWEIEPTAGLTDDDTFEGTWSYCCFADVTDLVHQWIEDGDLSNNAEGTYTLGHKIAPNQSDSDYSFTLYAPGPDPSTGYPLGTPAPGPTSPPSAQLLHQYCHSGWSLIVIYTSPETQGHQLYLFDIQNPGFNFTQARTQNPDFDGDGEPGGRISGFLVPDPVPDEDIAAKVTVFVGEGDSFIEGDQIKMNGHNLSNALSPWNNVWNSVSPGLSVSGVDVDTFVILWDDNILETGDTSAQVDLPTADDGFNMVYIILSFRSDVKTGGTIGFVLPT